MSILQDLLQVALKLQKKHGEIPLGNYLNQHGISTFDNAVFKHFPQLQYLPVVEDPNLKLGSYDFPFAEGGDEAFYSRPNTMYNPMSFLGKITTGNTLYPKSISEHETYHAVQDLQKRLGNMPTVMGEYLSETVPMHEEEEAMGAEQAQWLGKIPEKETKLASYLWGGKL